jgi:hypothetical protein
MRPTQAVREFEGRAGGAAQRAGSPQSRPDAPAPRAGRRALYDLVERHLERPGDRSEDVQHELVCWLRLLAATEADLRPGTAGRQVLQRLEREASAAITALLSEQPSLVFARTLRYRTEMELLRHSNWLTRKLVNLSDGDPAVFVGAGVSLTMLAGVIGDVVLRLLLLWWSAGQGPDVGLLTVAEAAFLGGGVSVLARLREFSCAKIRDFEPLFLFWNAVSNPLVAIIFGVFVYSLLTSGLVPLEKNVLASLASGGALWAIGFLSGFSERFTSDIISRSEGVLGAGNRS